VGEKPHHPEGGRAHQVEHQPDTFEGSQQLLGPAGRDTCSIANRLHSDAEAVSNRVRSRRPHAPGVSVDLAHEIGRKPRRDPLERVTDAGSFRPSQLGCARGYRVGCRPGLDSRSPHLPSSPNCGVLTLQEGASDVPAATKAIAD